MAFSVVRSVLSNGHTLLAAARQCTVRAEASKMAVALGKSLQTQRGLTRSLWYLSSAQQQSPVTAVKISKSCGCCGLHTEGDRDMAGFLSEEIELERKSEKSPGKMPSMKGFDLSTDGADVTLTKKIDNETITVKFNVTNTVGQDEDQYDDTEEAQNNPEKAAEMTSKPPFNVEINKGGDLTFLIQCRYPEYVPEIPEEDGGIEFLDLLLIDAVSIIKKDGEWTEKDYAVSGSNMDGTLYDMCLHMMEERGLDGKFAEELINFSTAFEHKLYINFLENLQQFAKSK